ncbi:aminoglycoside 6-adenylyltransferase [Anaerosolibacter carboniphilus]|uniref:Aminoglycoside 6-adenylyltransferase n=1 Tax=Anaerosolibacter carboniphilus TaxID=1417629 RepID=A0A841L0M2_9FIRM|nr:aminoglycoside 6-adenylyltransferase [Anaerosolibacter carboniphilus]MBB6218128.1 aminoglycoside 6-adenylyltransferase [Anaerosolibacter carboniphilus]
MREESTLIKQILDFAQEESSVRAVALNGSRVNPNVIRDIMQDYDVTFFIRNFEDISYKTNPNWIKRFGELIIFQQNDFKDGSYVFLMQFKEGVRIDLSFKNVMKVDEVIKEDSLTKILLDKDNIIPALPLPNDYTYYVKKPAQKEYDTLMNEAWWIQTYIAKAIWRDELPLAKYMFDVILIDCIRTILSWYIGINYDWNINVGKCGKWFKRFLPESIYNEFITLYPTIDYDEMWHTLFEADKFIRKIGSVVAEKLGYTYPMNDDMNVTEYLKTVQALPQNAAEFCPTKELNEIYVENVEKLFE